MAFFSVKFGLIEESSSRRFVFIKGVIALKPLGERLESDKVGRSHDLANGGQKYAAQNKSAKLCSSKSERRMDLKECELNSPFYKLLQVKLS